MEDERKPFNVRDYLDRPEVIESYIGNLKVEIDRLQAGLDQLEKSINTLILKLKPPGDLAQC